MQLATIIGNVGTVPEIRRTNDGQRSFVTFRIATDTKRTDPQTGITTTDTLWWQVMHDESRFTGVRPYIVKGTKVCIYGHMTATPYQKKDGSLDPGLAIRAHSIELCGAKDETTQQPQQTAGGSSGRPQLEEMGWYAKATGGKVVDDGTPMIEPAKPQPDSLPF